MVRAQAAAAAPSRHTRPRTNTQHAHTSTNTHAQREAADRAHGVVPMPPAQQPQSPGTATTFAASGASLTDAGHVPAGGPCGDGRVPVIVGLAVVARSVGPT